MQNETLEPAYSFTHTYSWEDGQYLTVTGITRVVEDEERNTLQLYSGPHFTFVGEVERSYRWCVVAMEGPAVDPSHDEPRITSSTITRVDTFSNGATAETVLSVENDPEAA